MKFLLAPDLPSQEKRSRKRRRRGKKKGEGRAESWSSCHVWRLVALFLVLSAARADRSTHGARRQEGVGRGGSDAKESGGDAEEEDDDAETPSGGKVNSTCDSVVKKSTERVQALRVGDHAEPSPGSLGHFRLLTSAACLWWSFPPECCASALAKWTMLSVATFLGWNCFCRVCLTAHQEK